MITAIQWVVLVIGTLWGAVILQWGVDNFKDGNTVKGVMMFLVGLGIWSSSLIGVLSLAVLWAMSRG
jgi:hypothetical protein